MIEARLSLSSPLSRRPGVKPMIRKILTLVAFVAAALILALVTAFESRNTHLR
jgi:F0F1-type ATP synthase membrane subunit c/vacuolar-type H+-ATPase subunit K